MLLCKMFSDFKVVMKKSNTTLMATMPVTNIVLMSSVFVWIQRGAWKIMNWWFQCRPACLQRASFSSGRTMPSTSFSETHWWVVAENNRSHSAHPCVFLPLRTTTSNLNPLKLKSDYPQITLRTLDRWPASYKSLKYVNMSNKPTSSHIPVFHMREKPPC